jgi:hypothetical protein
VDSAGNAYVTGFTQSSDFPTANPLQPANGGFGDAFVTKLVTPLVTVTVDPTTVTPDQIFNLSTAWQRGVGISYLRLKLDGYDIGYWVESFPFYSPIFYGVSFLVGDHTWTLEAYDSTDVLLASASATVTINP